MDNDNDALPDIHLLELPCELLEKIFSYVSYEEIGKLRKTCKRFKDVGSQILNSSFQRLQSTMLQRFQSIKAQMPRRESARRMHPLVRECDIVETVHMRLTLLQMSFGKHIERKHCCFFPGEILDEVYRIFRYIKTAQNLARAYKVTDELFDLTTMAMEYFKDRIEPGLPEITYFATDFLDYNSFSSSGSKSCSWKSSSATESTASTSSSRPAEKHHDVLSTNAVLNRKVKCLRQGMKRNNSRISLLNRKLSLCNSKYKDHQKQLIDQGSRLEGYEKKNEENSHKFNTLFQELNKCKTELQYWRSKSPANQLCWACSTKLVATDEQPIVVNVKREGGVVADSANQNASSVVVVTTANDVAACYSLSHPADGAIASTSACDFVPIPVAELAETLPPPFSALFGGSPFEASAADDGAETSDWPTTSVQRNAKRKFDEDVIDVPPAVEDAPVCKSRRGIQCLPFH